MQVTVTGIKDPTLLRELMIADLFVMHESTYTGAVFMRAYSDHVDGVDPLSSTAFSAVVIAPRGISADDDDYIAPGTILVFSGDEPVTKLTQVEPLALRGPAPDSREIASFVEICSANVRHTSEALDATAKSLRQETPAPL